MTTTTYSDAPDCENPLLRGKTYYHAQEPEDSKLDTPPYLVNKISLEHIVNLEPFNRWHAPSYKNPPYVPCAEGSPWFLTLAAPARDSSDVGYNGSDFDPLKWARV